MKIKTQFYGLNKKIITALKKGFRLSEIVKLTIKINSSLSNINMSYYLKVQIPILHRQFFRIISQNPEYVKTVCNDLNIPFHFACHEFILEKSS